MYYIVITKASPQLQGKRESTHTLSYATQDQEPRRLLFQVPTRETSHYAHVSFAPPPPSSTGEQGGKAAKPFAAFPFSMYRKMQYGQNNKKRKMPQSMQIGLHNNNR